MSNRKTFQRLVGFGVVFAMSLGLLSGGVGHFNRYTTEAAVKNSAIKLSKEADKAYKEVESLISKSDIKNNFEKLTKTQRVRGTKENKEAGKYIFDTVKGYGYDVKFQNFNGYDEKLADLNGNINKNQKKEKVLFKGRNIIVKRKDANPKLKTVIFSARYDSYKGSIGALDNAGGVAALMEMARVLSDKELSYNPEFVFFDSEHLRRGSRHFVASLSKEEKDNIYGVVNINSIGNKKQRKQMFFASKKDKSELKKQCEKYFPGIVNYESAGTDATTFTLEKIPTLCYFTYDIFASPKDVKIKIKDYVKEKDTSLVDMDTLVYDTAFITTYAYLLNTSQSESNKVSTVNKSATRKNPDIINDFTCSELTDDMAAKIGNEVKEIMIDGQEGAYKLDNFTIAFSNQTKKDKDIFIDITVMADWKTIRKPEDSPVIIGMNEVAKELKTKEEIDKAKEIISGYIAEMNPYNKMERLPDYFKLRFIKGNTNKYELLFPERIGGKTTLYPLKEYYNKNFKENREERMKLGRETLLRDLKAW